MEAFCKLCLSKDCHIKNIADYEVQKNRPGELGALIMEATGIQIDENDLVQGLCASCTGTVIAIVKFRRKCQRINEEVRSMGLSLLEERENPLWHNSLENDDNTVSHVVQVVHRTTTETRNEFKWEQLPKISKKQWNAWNKTKTLAKTTGTLRGTKRNPDKLTADGKIKYSKDPGLCEICGTHYSYLRSHMVTHKDASLALKHKCNVCGKIFRRNTNLRKHEMYHREPQYSCEICGKRMYKKDKLLYHIMTHSDERPFPCDICNKRFRDKKHLDIHFRMHTGVRPHVCSICDKRFTTQGGLAQHTKGHKNR